MYGEDHLLHTRLSFSEALTNVLPWGPTWSQGIEIGVTMCGHRAHNVLTL